MGRNPTALPSYGKRIHFHFIVHSNVCARIHQSHESCRNASICYRSDRLPVSSQTPGCTRSIERHQTIESIPIVRSIMAANTREMCASLSGWQTIVWWQPLMNCRRRPLSIDRRREIVRQLVDNSRGILAATSTIVLEWKNSRIQSGVVRGYEGKCRWICMYRSAKNYVSYTRGWWQLIKSSQKSDL